MSTDRPRFRLLSVFLFVGLTVFIAHPANAQNRLQARVMGFVEGVKSDPVPHATAKLGDRVTIRIEPSLIVSASKTADASASNSPDKAVGDQTKTGSDEEQSWIPGVTHSQILKLVPYLASRPLKGLYPETVDPDSHTLTYHLARTDASNEAWTDLLSNPGLDPREMRFSVGLEDKQQFPTSATLGLIIIPQKWLILALVVFLILLYIFFRLAIGTSLLRDPGASKGYMPGLSILWRHTSVDTKLGPFSLARTQMAFWFFLVITAFVFIWMIIGDTNTITQGVLVLIGISAGTALGATAIDSSKQQKLPAPPPVQDSRGFLNDLLSDGTGVSFHRFQIVVWTIVLGFIFSRRVMNHLAMPDFGTNLLTLMGISSGTYLGLKLPEQQAPESPPPAPPNTTAVAPTPAPDAQGPTTDDQPGDAPPAGATNQ